MIVTGGVRVARSRSCGVAHRGTRHLLCGDVLFAGFFGVFRSARDDWGGKIMGRAPVGGNIDALLGEFRHALSREVRDTALRAFIQRQADVPVLSAERAISIDALGPNEKRFHGTKVPLFYFPGSVLASPCADKFGYLTPAAVRTATKLPFNVATQSLLGQLGVAMGNPAAQAGPDSTIDAGFTYFGQFVDHDITFD